MKKLLSLINLFPYNFAQRQVKSLTQLFASYESFS
jgi:hypothetical protein